jgi:putative membrane protein
MLIIILQRYEYLYRKFKRMDNLFKYALALHIIFIVTWFAGLFYIVRLFIYHTEAEQKMEPERSILQAQYKVMEKRLWYGITWPSMIITLIMGPWVMSYNFSYYITSAYFILKLCFVAALVLYHLQCHVMFKQLQNNIVKHGSFKLRLWNEVATVLLFAIVFLIVLKSNTGFVWGMLGLIIFSATLMIAIRIYKKSREKSELDGSIKKEDTKNR